MLALTLVILVGCEPKTKIEEVPWTPINPPIEVTPEPEPIEKPERIEQELYQHFTGVNVKHSDKMEFEDLIARGYTTLRIEVSGTGDYLNWVTLDKLMLNGHRLRFDEVPGIYKGSDTKLATTGIMTVPFGDSEIIVDAKYVSAAMNFRIAGSTEPGYIEFDITGLADLEFTAKVTGKSMLEWLNSFKFILT